MPKRKPTEKQAKAVGHLVANPDATISEAMREAGYSEKTIDNPGNNFVGLKGTLSMVEQFGLVANQKLNNEYITTKIQELMEADKIHSSHTEADRVIPDWDARDKGLKHAFNARGLNQQVGQQNNIQVNFGDLKDKYKKG